MKIAAIIVTHNSAAVIGKTVAALRAQTCPPTQIVVVDSGSTETAYLDRLSGPDLIIICEQNIGFCAGNNRGIRAAENTIDAYAFVNPDCFLAPDWLEKASATLAAHPKTGVLASPLLGYDLTEDKPSGRYDTTGLYRTWYGRWYDRHQRMACDTVVLPQSPFSPLAICGALMLIPHAAMQQLLATDGFVFDETLFMYKEDVDLSRRLVRMGFSLLIDPALTAWHCRGWQPSRKAMPLWTRRISARNDVRVGWKHRSIYLPFYIAKYLYVRCCER